MPGEMAETSDAAVLEQPGPSSNYDGRPGPSQDPSPSQGKATVKGKRASKGRVVSQGSHPYHSSSAATDRDAERQQLVLDKQIEKAQRQATREIPQSPVRAEPALLPSPIGDPLRVIEEEVESRIYPQIGPWQTQVSPRLLLSLNSAQGIERTLGRF